MFNIGVVVYTRGEAPGTLTSKWRHLTNGSGTGISTGGPLEGFAGRYRTIHYDEKGNEKLSFELLIETNDDVYDLSWINNGEIRGRGIGMKVSEGLAAGYRFDD